MLTHLVAAYVDQAITTPENKIPKTLFNLIIIANPASPMTGSKQYPSTEHVSQKSIPLEFNKFKIVCIPKQPNTLNP